jgi:DNA end-binding protein Ku
MVSIPVALFPAVQEHDVHFHQIHRKCGSRIKQQKWCPVDEEAVAADDIARGYEISKGRYVIIEDEDLDSLPIPTLHTITVSAFVNVQEIDPLFFDQPYYLEPEETGKKPYALLRKALISKNVAAVAKIAIRSKESLTLLRAAGDRILLETLHFPDEIREMPHAADVKVEDKELKLAESLIDLLTDLFEALRKSVETAKGNSRKSAPGDHKHKVAS